MTNKFRKKLEQWQPGGMTRHGGLYVKDKWNADGTDLKDFRGKKKGGGKTYANPFNFYL
jgi:hypothetical protein